MLSKANGFTFLELLLVVSLLGVVSSAAAPAFINMWYLQQLRHYAQLTLAEVNAARQRAILHERDVFVQFRQTHLCTWYAGDNIEQCQRSGYELANNFRYTHNFGTEGIISFTAGRGFAAFSAGRLTLYGDVAKGSIEFVMSSLGRVRACQARELLHGVPLCA